MKRKSQENFNLKRQNLIKRIKDYRRCTLVEKQRQTKKFRNSIECFELKPRAVSLGFPAPFCYLRQPLFIHLCNIPIQRRKFKLLSNTKCLSLKKIRRLRKKEKAEWILRLWTPQLVNFTWHRFGFGKERRQQNP